jgi:hypothetical protein
MGDDRKTFGLPTSKGKNSMYRKKADGPDRKITSDFNRRMNLYSLAAAAAGVSLLALASPAIAEVVVTKANLPIVPLVGVSLDLNHDGTTDFYFSLFSYKEFGRSFLCDLNVVPERGAGAVATHPRQLLYVSALAQGAKIGPSARFSPDSSHEIIEDSLGAFTSNHITSRFIKGKWGNDPANRYIGVKFQIDDETHYGWVRLKVTMSGTPMSIRGMITAYAYETAPNTPIYAGLTEEPAAELQTPQSLPHQKGPSPGMLALGAESVPLWRREEVANSK